MRKRTTFRYLLRKTRNAGTAEDLTQDAFLRLFRHLRAERLLDNPTAWLLTVANKLAIDESRGDRGTMDLDESAWNQIKEKTTTSITLWLDRFIGEVLPDPPRQAKSHRISVVGGDKQVAAVSAAISPGDRFMVEGSGV